MINDLQYSQAGLSLTKSFEGLRLKAYQDAGGVWTIGYGHTGRGVFPGREITEATAEALLRGDLMVAVMLVGGVVKVPLAQHQFDALVDFAYNAGQGSFMHSTLLEKVQAGDFAAAAIEFGKWVNVDGRPEPGLVRRRSAEAAMFVGETV